MKLYKVKLTKVRSTHTKLRTDEVEGGTSDLPQIGENFVLLGQGLEFGSRIITTTEVKSVEKIKNEYMFSTLNSTYKLEVLAEINSDNVIVE